MKRLFDIVVVLCALPAIAPLAALVAVAVRVTSPGPVLYWSDRVGAGNRLFRMPKFRTMRVGTPAVATHLLADPRAVLTPCGGFLRATSLDEIPQLWSVLVGDMSLVGPRPALFNQDDLIAGRTEFGLHKLRPGVTGWAQINGRDSISVPEKVTLDADYARRQGFFFDLKILVLTLIRVVSKVDVAH
jgi:O-antigen biosynthesis protein WbqP